MEDVQFSTPYPSKTTQLDIPHTSVNPVVSMDTRMLSNEASLGTQNWHRPFMYPKWELLVDKVLRVSFCNFSVEYPGYRSWISKMSGRSHRTQLCRSPVINPTWSKSEDRLMSNPLTKKNDNSRSNVKRRTYMSKQVRDFAATHHVKRLSFTEAEDLYLGTSSNNMLSTKVDPSVRNQTEQPQDDDVEMETFYHSLGAKSHAFRSCDKSASTVLSKKAREALKIVQDFILDDALVLKRPERFSIIKNSLEYLSTLSTDDGMSIAMGSLISEALGKFTRWSRDYTETSMKIETTASELQRADKLEAGLESNKNQFMELLALENELQEKLAWMEKRKENLEEEIKDIKANISASETEKNMVHQRKRNVFEEGKALKTQRDELMEKAPRLQQEHGLAMETQTRIKAEWLELREKFEKVAAECDVPSEIRLLSRTRLLLLMLLLLLLLLVVYRILFQGNEHNWDPDDDHFKYDTYFIGNRSQEEMGAATCALHPL